MADISPETIRLVQTSWAAVLPISDAAASLFYDRLFALDPSTRPLFKKDLTDQKKKLMQTLHVAVNGLGDVGKLVPVLEQLGARHAGYMVREEHFGLVGQALLWTLREGLGDAFTPATEKAWTDVYGVVSGVMVGAMRRAAGAAAFGGPGTQATSAPAAAVVPFPKPMASTLSSPPAVSQPVAPGAPSLVPISGVQASPPPSAGTGSLRLELDPSTASVLAEALRARASSPGPSAFAPKSVEAPAAAAAPASAWLATSALVGALGGIAVGAAMGPADASALARAAPVALALGAVWAAGVWLGRHLGAPR